MTDVENIRWTDQRLIFENDFLTLLHNIFQLHLNLTSHTKSFKRVHVNRHISTSITVVIPDQMIIHKAPNIWYPSKLQGPPLKILLKLLKPSLVSFSPNNPTATSFQAPLNKCTGIALTGSSIFSISNSCEPIVTRYIISNIKFLDEEYLPLGKTGNPYPL